MTTGQAGDSGRQDSLSPLQLLVLATAVSLVAGYLELVMVAIDWYGFGRYSTRSPDTVWMTPLGHLAVALLATAPVATAGLLIGRRVAVHRAWFVLTWLCGLSALLTYYPRLSFLSLVVLSAGFATTAARLASKNPGAARSRANWLAGGLGSVLLLTIAGLQGYHAVRERLVASALPRANNGAPNILLIILDTVRAQNLSLYGYSRPTTPQLQQFATRGTRFDLAISAAPWTTPSHATIFTGRYLPQHGADLRSDMTDSLPTLAEVLAAHGYRTGGFSANKIHAGRSFGFARGFQHFEDFMVSAEEVANSTSLARFFITQRRWRKLTDSRQLLGRKSADDVNSSFLRWERQRSDRPYFAFLNYYDAHDPYVPPEPFAGQFGASRVPATIKQRIRGLIEPGFWPKPSMDAYDASIAYIDDRLGRLFADLDRDGSLANTLVFVMADHGEEFGEHGDWGHGFNLYLPNLHVPLIMVFPGHVPAGAVVTSPVTLRDIPATIADLAGFGRESPFRGRSLAERWEHDMATPASTPLSEVSGDRDKPPQSAISRGDMVSVIRDSLHLIRNGDGVLELYDVRQDPSALSDLWSKTDDRVRTELNDLLDSLAAARSR